MKALQPFTALKKSVHLHIHLLQCIIFLILKTCAECLSHIQLYILDNWIIYHTDDRLLAYILVVIR